MANDKKNFSIDVNVSIEGIYQLTEALALLGSALAFKEDMAKTAEDAIKLAEEATKVKKEEPKKKEAGKKEEAPTQEENKSKDDTEVESNLTLSDVRNAFLTKNKDKTKTAELKALLTEFKVEKVSDLTPKDFEAVLKALKEL